MKCYAGIGSRSTPTNIMDQMSFIASKLEKNGFTLRSGGAQGADKAFERGTTLAKEIWIPFNSFNGYQANSFTKLPTPEHESIASTLLPYWNNIGNKKIKLLHSRNVCQILGDLTNNNSKFVICWTPDGAETEAQVNDSTGGTKTAIILADRHNIPVFNMYNADWLTRFKAFVKTI